MIEIYGQLKASLQCVGSSKHSVPLYGLSCQKTLSGHSLRGIYAGRLVA